ncbi:MAG: NADH-quinone oxidoreductase subunit M [Proteobacteria bacterium]|nr:NADH-quinone oxidoreductase subunit M [Pseudomonadota bacterium]
MMLLTAIVLLPLLGALVVALLPRAEERAARHLGFCFALLTFAVSLGLVAFRPAEAGWQFVVRRPWVASLGIDFHLAVDGISLWLVLLTTLLMPIVLLSTYRAINTRVKEFLVAMLVLEAGMLGVFLALDLFLFYVFWELVLVPMYLIIGIWGHGDRIFAALKFVLYTVVGSLLMLAAIIYLYVTHGQATGNYTFDYTTLMLSVWGHGDQLWLFLAFALAFAIKVPLFPLHTWLPDAHTQAPTAGSVVLAGVLLKLGTYGFLRFALPLFPWAAAQCSPYLVALAVIGILYGALVAYAQQDAKRLVAYSSVSHLGFVMLGLLAMNSTGLQGSIFQMLSHGISTGGLFLAIGVLYERRHTNELAQFGGIWRPMPIFAGLFMVMMLSSAGLPGLSGFVGEFLILVGAFTHRFFVDGGEQLRLLTLPGVWHWGPRVVAGLAALGVVLGAVYLLAMFQKLMFGPITQPKNAELRDLDAREIAVFAPLVVLTFVMGLYPRPFLAPMEPSVNRLLHDYRVRYAASREHSGSGVRQLAGLGAAAATQPEVALAPSAPPPTPAVVGVPTPGRGAERRVVAPRRSPLPSLRSARRPRGAR